MGQALINIQSFFILAVAQLPMLYSDSFLSFCSLLIFKLAEFLLRPIGLHPGNSGLSREILLWSAQLHLHAESPHGWDPQLEAHPKGDSDPGGPNDTQRIITNQKQQIKYPCYRIRDTQSLKDKQIHDNVQLPSSRGTMTQTLTL